MTAMCANPETPCEDVLPPIPAVPVPCTEDMDCWNCQTMGNHLCGAPAVPIGFEDKYGQAGWTLEDAEIHAETAVAPPPAVLAYTGAPTALTGGFAGILLGVGLLLSALSRRLTR